MKKRANRQVSGLVLTSWFLIDLAHCVPLKGAFPPLYYGSEKLDFKTYNHLSHLTSKDCKCDYEGDGVMKTCGLHWHCTSDQFQCGKDPNLCKGYTCIPKSKHCDGRDDCGKASCKSRSIFFPSQYTGRSFSSVKKLKA